MSVKHTSLTVMALLIMSAMLPVVADSQQNGQSRGHEEKTDSRIHDSAHNDYHPWDKNEDQAWRKYLSGQHLKYRNYSHATAQQQSGYWAYRHQTLGANDPSQTNNTRPDGTRSPQNQRADDNSGKRQ